MRKISGTLCILLGTALILSALFLFGHNRSEDQRAGEEAAEVTKNIREQIQHMQETSQDEPEKTPDPKMPVKQIDGYDYVGYITISGINIELPVMAQWDYARLKIAPCRQFGSSRTDDLVIAAHNYEAHCGKLKELVPGDTVVFTDMEGIVNQYTVAKTEVLDPTLVDEVEKSGYDLVLYTCTYGGKTRVTVFCDRAEREQ